MFEVGDKIICIDIRNLNITDLTIDKIYIVYFAYKDYINIRDNSNMIITYESGRFISLIEYRKRTILKLKERICLKSVIK